MYWKLLALPIAVTVKVPLYPATATPAIVTLLPTASPTGLAVVIVTVTVVPLSDVDEIALEAPAHTAGSPAHDATPAAHFGIELVAVKASVAGLYNSAVFRATCPAGAPAGVEVPMKDCPVVPPTINTCPSSGVPLPSIRVALAPARAAVINPPLPLPASVNDFVFLLYNSAVCSAVHSNPETALIVAGTHL
jgi:hypothetical protein